MKKQIIIIITGTILLISASAVMAFCKTKAGMEDKSNSAIIGAWQLDSYKYGSTSSSFTTVTSDRIHIKMITENRFLWAIYDATTKQIVSSAGGTYSLKGEKCIESVDYGYNNDNILGTKSNFIIRIEDDVIFLSGSLGIEYKIEEIWKKVK